MEKIDQIIDLCLERNRLRDNCNLLGSQIENGNSEMDNLNKEIEALKNKKKELEKRLRQSRKK